MELNEMIRFTFVIGAGKLGRARYDDGAARAVTSTLRELGFEEDRGASAVMECAGTFKLQHDTGKNLKTVVVFPTVAAVAGQNGVEGEMAGLGLGSFLAEDSIEHKLAYTSMNVFPRMVESQCVTWSQKKECMSTLSDLMAMVEKLDEILMQGQQLKDPEQDFYDSVSATSLEQKIACVRDLMHKQVDDGAITAEEKRTLVNQVETKIKDLAKSIEEAERDSKPKRVENLKAVEEKALSRKEKLSPIVPRPPPRLKNEAAITKLRTEMDPLLEIEEAGKGRLLSLKESQSVARKDEILEEIEALEVSACGMTAILSLCRGIFTYSLDSHAAIEQGLV
jgi:hypothetical protein